MSPKIKYLIKFYKTSLILIAANLIFLICICYFLYSLYFKTQIPVSVLAPHIYMGKIELSVGDIRQMKDFYSNMIGMQIIFQNNNSVTLGYNHNPILQLNASNLPQSSESDPGLDQIAIVFSSRHGLSNALQKILERNPSLYAGGTNRGAIGEAFYVTDPSGNSLELYYDTNPSTWPRTIKGNVEGNSLPINIEQYIQKYIGESGSNAMKLGHLQIRIGDISLGRQFYINTIGFYAIPQLLGGRSIFMSDGFYHHDLVINQIQGYDGDPVTNYQGLRGFSFSLPNSFYLNNLKTRLTAANVAYKTKANEISFIDPWGILITVSSLPNWFDNILKII